MARTQQGDTVMARTVRLIEAFRPGEQWLAVSELSRRTGLHLATTSRLVAELCEHQWLERDEQRRVRLGIRLWEVASRASTPPLLRDMALPVLEHLHQRIGHHVHLAVLQGTEVLFLERLSAPESVVNYSRTAGRVSTHASSAGLVLLAHADPVLQDAVLDGDLVAFTGQTPTDPQRLRAIMADIRTRGSVVCTGFLHPDATGIAAPVMGPSRAVAAISAVVPTDADHAGIERSVVRAAAEVSRRIGRSRPGSAMTSPDALGERKQLSTIEIQLFCDRGHCR